MLHIKKWSSAWPLFAVFFACLCFSVSTAFATDSEGSVLIFYGYQDGTPAAGDYYASGVYGSSFSIVSPVIDGYYNYQPVVSGVFSSKPIVIRVTYYPDEKPPPDSSSDSDSSSVPPLDKGSYIVHYWYSASIETAAPTVTITGDIGSVHSITLPTIAGYHLDFELMGNQLNIENNVLTFSIEEPFGANIFYSKDAPLPPDSSSDSDSSSVPPPDSSSGSGDSSLPPAIEIDPEYLGFEVDGLYKMADTLRFNIGSAFTMFIFVFVLLLGLYKVLNVISFFFR